MRGLVPRWGGGEGRGRIRRANSLYRTTTPAFHTLGVPAEAGMSDWYESMYGTPIRDAPTPLRLCLGIPSIFRIVIGMTMTIQPTFLNCGSCPTPHFVIRGIPSSLRPPNSSFRRRPESRGCGEGRGNPRTMTARQHVERKTGTSCRGQCSAGACPPLGSGWGVAESAVPTRCTKPQLRLFIPSVCRRKPG